MPLCTESCTFNFKGDCPVQGTALTALTALNTPTTLNAPTILTAMTTLIKALPCLS